MLGRHFIEHAEKKTTVSKTDVALDFIVNIGMNKLMVKLLVHTGQLSAKNEGYVFDYDNQFIPTDKNDTKWSYKHTDGYFPCIASIGNFPDYIENRNGNSNVKCKQDETLERAYEALGENGIKVKHSRMNCRSFDQKVVPLVESNSKYLYIRAQRCASLYEIVRGMNGWKKETIGFKEYEVASIEYAPFGWNKTHRYMITREKKADGLGVLFTGNNYTYRVIMTNNRKMTDFEVVEFYNDRTESEREFDEMDNDFFGKRCRSLFAGKHGVSDHNGHLPDPVSLSGGIY